LTTCYPRVKTLCAVSWTTKSDAATIHGLFNNNQPQVERARSAQRLSGRQSVSSQAVTTSVGLTIARLRLDVWLDITCLFKTRSAAQKACKGGKVDVNGQRAKSHREISTGDRITITRAFRERQLVIVGGLTEQNVARAKARTLYEDATPSPSEEEAALRELVRLANRANPPVRSGTAPTKRERRNIRRLKRGND